MNDNNHIRSKNINENRNTYKKLPEKLFAITNEKRNFGNFINVATLKPNLISSRSSHVNGNDNSFLFTQEKKHPIFSNTTPFPKRNSINNELNNRGN